VLTAMGVPRGLAVCAIRFSFGRTSTAGEVEGALAALAAALPAARAVAAARA
jgi:cysteine sulfinate desulfinase/cysteine desulfurase-like protein